MTGEAMLWLRALLLELALPQALGLGVGRSWRSTRAGILGAVAVLIAVLTPPAVYLVIDWVEWSRFAEAYARFAGHEPCSLLRRQASQTAILGTATNGLLAVLLQVWLRRKPRRTAA